MMCACVKRNEKRYTWKRRFSIDCIPRFTVRKIFSRRDRMRVSLSRLSALRGVESSDVWALYGRLVPAVRAAMNERGGQALRAISQRVSYAERAALDAAEVRDASDSCAEMRQLAELEIEEARSKGAMDVRELIETLSRTNSNSGNDNNNSSSDPSSALLEIRAGTGGLEASLFVVDLLGMYEKLAVRRRWKFRMLASSDTGVGGLREAAVRVSGGNSFQMLQREAGVHRVQRVPATESAGRVHTSTVTVSVLRGVKPREVRIELDPSDIRVDVYRASGAGGQHVNTTESAVRMTHVPTGIVATSQDERSQHRNRATCLESLQERVAAKQVAEDARKRSDEKRAQMGASASGGERSDRIRTYNFPQGRVTDHRIVPDARLIQLIPSARHVIGDKSAPLAAVLDGTESLERIIEEVKRVEELENIRMLVEQAEKMEADGNHGDGKGDKGKKKKTKKAKL